MERLILTQKEINTIKLTIAFQENRTYDSISSNEVFDYLEDLEDVQNQASVYVDREGELNYREPWTKQEIAYEIVGNTDQRFFNSNKGLIINNYQTLR